MPEPTNPTQPTLGDRPPAPPVERRRQPRQPCRPYIFVRLCALAGYRPFKAVVREVSASGIDFLHDSPLQPGTELALQLKAGMPGETGVRKARVAHATPSEGAWLIGCTVSPPFRAAELESLR